MGHGGGSVAGRKENRMGCRVGGIVHNTSVNYPEW